MMENFKPIRKFYILRLVFRVAVLIGAFVLYIAFPKSFGVMAGWDYFKEFSVLHIMWAIWVFDMVLQLIPSRQYLTLGAQKQFFKYFIPANLSESYKGLKQFIRSSNYAGLKTFLVWSALTIIIGGLKVAGIIGKNELFIITAVFYVLDIVFVLYWCPFKAWLLKNKCCTTCRIFNWDHLMMFSPFLFVMGFYTLSLFIFALIVFIVWEVCIITHPERFWEGTNDALKCKNCTDLLCGGKYCDHDILQKAGEFADRSIKSKRDRR